MIGCFFKSVKHVVRCGMPRVPGRRSGSATGGGFKVEHGHLYIVATPIGNLSDMSMRGIEVLKNVDVIAAEDTRNTRSLLSAFSIPLRGRKLLSHHMHNTEVSVKGLLNLLRQGNSMALVSDAGTPTIADPGSELVAVCAMQSPPIPVQSIPGPSAVISAVSLSGYGGPFFFRGFLSRNNRKRKVQLSGIASTEHVVVLYESPHRIVETLTDLASLQEGRGAHRGATLCKELTKAHETVVRGTISSLLQWALSVAEKETRIRGEICLVIDRQVAPKMNESREDEGEEAVRSALHELRRDGMSRSESVDIVCEMLSRSRSSVYKTALQIQWPP
eukprot:GSChrysophyteH1.ASY1.ANO1.2682.1 assembled CDS